MLSVEKMFGLHDVSRYPNYVWLLQNTDFVEAVLEPTHRELTRMIDSGSFDFLCSLHTYVKRSNVSTEKELASFEALLRGYSDDKSDWLNTFKLVEAGFTDFLVFALGVINTYIPCAT